MTNDQALASIPEDLRSELLQAFNAIVTNFRERRWEPAELNGGKLCEVVHSILRGYVDGRYPSKATKTRNMVDSCRAFENVDARFPRSIRVQIPRVLMALYEIRNNRGVGHVGGDVDPNQMDAMAVVELAKWTMAELVRVYHNVSTAEASEIVRALVERQIPLVWEVEGNRRVLDPSLSKADQALVLLYSQAAPVAEGSLYSWVEHSNHSVFRNSVLGDLHERRLIEFNRQDNTVRLSPNGAAYVEANILARSAAY